MTRFPLLALALVGTVYGCAPATKQAPAPSAPQAYQGVTDPSRSGAQSADVCSKLTGYTSLTPFSGTWSQGRVFQHRGKTITCFSTR